MSKKTAVEFLLKKLKDRGYLLEQDVAQAKEMEKEQSLTMSDYNLDELAKDRFGNSSHHTNNRCSYKEGFQKALELITFKSE